LRNISPIRLLIVFAVAFSLITIGGPMAANFRLPTVQLANANAQPCQTHSSSGACSEYWIPAGPTENYITTPIFTDETAEYTNLQSGSSSIDLTDWQCAPSVCPTLSSGSSFLVTAPVGQVGYYEIEFMQANNFWGCNFSFGNSACGVNVRQGLAHMIDKTSFTTNEGSIAGVSAPIDDAVPTTSAGGLTSPDPCLYDSMFTQSGVNCIVGAPGGTAYHLASSTGADGYAWLQAPGSADLNAAAAHFVAAGLATGYNTATSVLTGISSSAASNAPTFFIRNDNPPRLDWGVSMAAEICYLFTGSYTQPCTYLKTVEGPITAFPGFTTSSTGVNLNWWMYTAAFSGPTFFDGSLYFGYNSRFVSGVSSIVSPTGPCNSAAVPTQAAGNYEYICDPAYDNVSYLMETAPCLTAPGDPVTGATSNFPTGPGNGLCTSTTKLSAISAGIQAEAIAGAAVLTLPMFELTVQYGYLNGWQQVDNNAVDGLPNSFTWLNAYNPSPATPFTIRQGFKETTRSVNPYIASTVWDTYVEGNVYDTLYASDPLAPAQLINWMTVSTAQLTNSSLIYNGGVTGAPASTLLTYRFTLRPDLYFQDGNPVTAYDVAFSYLSMVQSGAFLGTGATTMSGITILNPHQFDIGVKSNGPFELATLTGIPIVSARYWTTAGQSAWGSAVATCTTSTCLDSQYTLTSSDTVACVGACTVSATDMTINTSDTAATYDPLAQGTLIGSGPWECVSSTNVLGKGCSSTGTENPPIGGSYTLTRYGNGLAPASSISGIYFRSAGDLALYIWSEQNDISPVLAFTSVAACYAVAVNLTGPCGHFQQGIGNAGSGTPVGVTQVGISSRFYNLNWLAPYEWTTSPPTGIIPLTPTLHEGSVTLSPQSAVGCPSGYDC
jgi:Bacterial extracellular solute-binding proteins, family 5 Middle